MNRTPLQSISHKPDTSYKIILLGSPRVGKTSLINSLLDVPFQANYIPTESPLNAKNILEVPLLDGMMVALDLWDTAGTGGTLGQSWDINSQWDIQEFYSQKVHGVIIVYDITDRCSFEQVEEWFYLAKSLINDDGCILLVGNKVDLESQREVSPLEASRWARVYDVPYTETSARRNIKVKDAFRGIAHQISDILAAKRSVSSGDSFDSIPGEPVGHEGSHKIGLESFMAELNKYGLKGMRKHLEFYSDDMIQYLQDMEQSNPEFLWTTLEEDFKLNFSRIIKFCVLLRKLKL